MGGICQYCGMKLWSLWVPVTKGQLSEGIGKLETWIFKSDPGRTSEDPFIPSWRGMLSSILSSPITRWQCPYISRLGVASHGISQNAEDLRLLNFLYKSKLGKMHYFEETIAVWTRQLLSYWCPATYNTQNMCATFISSANPDDNGSRMLMDR